jgi:hypothetical protein
MFRYCENIVRGRINDPYEIVPLYYSMGLAGDGSKVQRSGVMQSARNLLEERTLENFTS